MKVRQFRRFTSRVFTSRLHLAPPSTPLLGPTPPRVPSPAPLVRRHPGVKSRKKSTPPRPQSAAAPWIRRPPPSPHPPPESPPPLRDTVNTPLLSAIGVSPSSPRDHRRPPSMPPWPTPAPAMPEPPSLSTVHRCPSPAPTARPHRRCVPSAPPPQPHGDSSAPATRAVRSTWCDLPDRSPSANGGKVADGCWSSITQGAGCCARHWRVRLIHTGATRLR
jgi:hypothetical protein